MPAPSSTEGSTGLQSHPDKLTFVAPGWVKPIWTSADLSTMQVVHSELVWTRYDFASIRLEQVPALLIGQGLPIKDLFPPDGYLVCEDKKVPGPFFYLAGQPLVTMGAPRILGVVLGKVVNAGSQMKLDGVLGVMVAQVLASTTR